MIRPIIFRDEMVRAILSGRKTQTRRVIKHMRANRWTYVKPHKGGGWMATDGTEAGFVESGAAGFKCPYGQPGDRLWVRETWCPQPDRNPPYVPFYKTDFLPNEAHDISKTWGPWHSSIHMPRWASRITLEITNIRVERVQDITELDAKSEGVAKVINKKIHGWKPYALEFCILWNYINLKRGYGWNANPWVWVIEFKRIVTPAPAGKE